MDKKKLGVILMGVSAAALIFALVLYCVSAAFVGDIEDAISALANEDYSLIGGLDIDIDAGLVKEAIGLLDDMGVGGADISYALYEIGISSYGFDIFALYGRGWFLAAGIILALAGVVLMAFARDSKLASDLVELAKRFGKAVAAAFKELFASMPRPASRARYACPQCGAPYAAGVMFCGKCGSKLPDPASVGVCKHCGARNEPGSRFCAGCGQPLN